MAQIAWLGKKSPFCGNVSYGISTTEALRKRGHQVHFIHFDNPRSPERDNTSLLANDPDVSLPYLVKSQVYTIPSPGAQRELRESLERLQPDLVHASLTLSPLDFRLPELRAGGDPGSSYSYCKNGQESPSVHRGRRRMTWDERVERDRLP